MNDPYQQQQMAAGQSPNPYNNGYNNGYNNTYQPNPYNNNVPSMTLRSLLIQPQDNRYTMSTSIEEPLHAPFATNKPELSLFARLVESNGYGVSSSFWYFGRSAAFLFVSIRAQISSIVALLAMESRATTMLLAVHDNSYISIYQEFFIKKPPLFSKSL